MDCVLKERKNGEKNEIFDPIRKKWLIITPEERVRQTFILFLLNKKEIPASHISVEHAITVNGLTKRYDIVVFDNDKKPLMVIECKAPEVPITQSVIEQAGRYNKTLHAPIIGVTNGITQYFFSIDFETEVITPLP